MPPDLFRMRYRAELTVVIHSLVRQRLAATAGKVRATVPSSVSREDRKRFVKLVLKDFENLYEGNIARFGIRPSEFAAWKRAVKKR